MISMKITVLWALLFLSLAEGSLLMTGQIAYRSQRWSPKYYYIEATDGSAALMATVSRDHGFIECRVNGSESAVKAILQDPEVTLEIIGDEQVRGMWRRCQRTGATPTTTISPAAGQKKGSAARRAEGTTDLFSTPFPPDLGAGHPEGPDSHVAIVPGTKWCGKGNVATSYDDLGYKVETDKCCRDHDRCPYFIPGLTYKYNYNNLKPWTLSWCPCDMDLYNCLKAINNTSSNDVGEMFFGVLGVQCFNFRVDTYCEELHWTHLYCNHWETGYMAVMEAFPKTWDQDPGALIGR